MLKDVSLTLKGKAVLGGDLKLQGTLYTLAQGAGPYPLVILSHGSNADAATRRQFSTRSYWNTARYFLNRGFTVLYFLRPSYGESKGPYLQANNSCQNASYGAACNMHQQQQWRRTAQSLCPHLERYTTL